MAVLLEKKEEQMKSKLKTQKKGRNKSEGLMCEWWCWRLLWVFIDGSDITAVNTHPQRSLTKTMYTVKNLTCYAYFIILCFSSRDPHEHDQRLWWDFVCPRSLALSLLRKMFWVQYKPINNICDMLSTTGDHFKSALQTSFTVTLFSGGSTSRNVKLVFY